MPNALAAESSPYLRQHRDNPVQWLPWGEHALERARAEDRPLFLSIGYSSCHWCHVMEHESFEDPRTAALMNREFVCVKVDREERPDIDALYMEAVQAMTGHGGWPLSVFLTPEGVPFYGGTYFPPAARSGMPAFTEVLQAIAEAWREHAAEIRARGAEMTAQLRGAAALEPGGEQPGDAALDGAVERLAESFDHQHGGFGGAPKFPQAPVLELLLARAAHSDDEHGARAREMALGSLEAMAAGGIHDQIGGGFHRYAVDAAWRVPHFEKMLYDNALLARAYVHAHALGGGAGMAAVARDTLDWALREMLAPDGGFYSALDADSGGREGAYYVWSCEEVQAALGADAPAAIEWLGLGERGNFSDPHNPVPGLNVPRDALADSAPAEADVSVRARIRARLLATRELRERPGLDDKRLTAWNALMVTALAEAGDALGEPRYTEAARRCADFLLDRLRDDRGRLLRTNSGGAAKLDAYLEDHAFLLEALIALFEATCEERRLEQAVALADTLIARFADERSGGFFSTAHDAEALIARRKEIEDNPMPAGASIASVGLLRLAELTGEQAYRRHADGALALVGSIAERHPRAFAAALLAVHRRLAPPRPIACPLPARPSAAGQPAAGRQ